MPTNGSNGAGPRPDEQGPDQVSGVLPIGPPEPRALPIGPRAAVPAGRRALTRRERKAKKKLPLAPPPVQEELISPLADVGPWGDPRDEPPLVLEASDPKQMVRPYTRTGGRTHVGYRLELETLLATAEGRDYDIARLRDDHSAICEMCRAPQSVAEIAAKLVLPLGAARVLISDVVDAGLLSVHEPSAEGPSIDLMQRIAAGLRNL